MPVFGLLILILWRHDAARTGVHVQVTGLSPPADGGATEGCIVGLLPDGRSTTVEDLSTAQRPRTLREAVTAFLAGFGRMLAGGLKASGVVS